MYPKRAYTLLGGISEPEHLHRLRLCKVTAPVSCRVADGCPNLSMHILSPGTKLERGLLNKGHSCDVQTRYCCNSSAYMVISSPPDSVVCRVLYRGYYGEATYGTRQEGSQRLVVLREVRAIIIPVSGKFLWFRAAVPPVTSV